MKENCSYIQNPNYPSPYGSTSTISWTVSKTQNDVCSLRFDFDSFTTAGPTATDDSNGCPDSFAVTAVRVFFYLFFSFYERRIICYLES